MSNLYRQMEANVKGMLVVVWPLSVVLFLISIILMIEDYRTSLEGYAMVPTQKVDQVLLPYAVAAIPQLGTIVFFYMFNLDTNRRWSLIATVSLILVDVATDVLYKSGGETSRLIYAVPETLLIFTLGSELLFTVVGGFMVTTLPVFINSTSAIITSIWPSDDNNQKMSR